jgi:hypothetical protein
MIVVSSELVAALYVQGELTEIAEAVLRRDPAWASPMIWRAVLPHHLAPALRSGALSREVARRIITAAPELFRGREFPAPLENNMAVILGSSCSAFMAPFVTLAKGLGIPLITTDADALTGFPAIAVQASDFAAGR